MEASQASDEGSIPSTRSNHLGQGIEVSRDAAVVFLFVLAVSGCATPPSDGPGGRFDTGTAAVHRVQRGETLWSIARRYGVSVEEMVRANGISDVSRIEVGQRLRVPGSLGFRPVRPPPAAVVEEIVRAARPGTGRAGGAGEDFAWPVQGRVIGIFGTRGRGRVNKGIDIQARSGTEVRAARSGKVSFVHEGLPGFGKTIILEHAEGFASVYAYVGEILVRQGDLVAQRQVIARVGETGRTQVPALHFEIRRHQKAQNPLHYLP